MITLDESSSLKALDAAKVFEAHHLLVQLSVYKSTPVIKADYLAGPKWGFDRLTLTIWNIVFLSEPATLVLKVM